MTIGLLDKKKDGLLGSPIPSLKAHSPQPENPSRVEEMEYDII